MKIDPNAPAFPAYRPPMSDAELMSDLSAIDAEVARRKKSRTFEPYAAWALAARQAAIVRFEHRADALIAALNREAV